MIAAAPASALLAAATAPHTAEAAPRPAREERREASFYGEHPDRLPYRAVASVGLAVFEHGGAPGRSALGFDLRFEGRLLSWLLQPREGLTAYDALGSEGFFGGLARPDERGDPRRGAILGAAWYDLLPGIRSPDFTVFIGMRARIEYAALGSSHFGGWSFPLVARVELPYEGAKRLLLNAWGSAIGTRRALGGELDIGMMPRTFLSLSLDRTTGQVHLPDAPGIPRAVDGARWVATVGVRAGSVY
jgi:hypothetical protein